MKRLIYAMLCCCVLLTGGTARLSAQPQQPPPQRPAEQNEFVPVSEVPESDKLPAAPYLIAAYTLVWLILLVYVWSLWRRLSLVEQELKRALESASRE